jgi:hypothetical protein
VPDIRNAPGLKIMPRVRSLREGLSYITWRPPSRLARETQEWLYESLVEVSSQAFGADMTAYWQERCAGNYFLELQQFTLLLDKTEFIGWTGHHVRRFAGATCLYLDSTGVLPNYRGRRVIDIVQTHAVVRELVVRPHKRVYLAVRTESPVIYRFLQQAAGANYIYPSPKGSTPVRIQEIGSAIVAWLNQTDVFDPTLLKVAGAYSGLDALYGEMPVCSDEELNGFFKRELTPVDAFIVVVDATLLRAVKHFVRRWCQRRAIGLVPSHRRQAIPQSDNAVRQHTHGQ